MQWRSRRFLTVLLSVTMAACADSPTSPTLSPEGSPREIVYYPGESGECDPWLNLDWCEGDGSCMTGDASAGGPEGYVGPQGCPGDGPGGGGAAPPDQPPADTACRHTDATVNDHNVQAGLQNLWEQSNANLSQGQRLENAGWIVQNPDGTRSVTPFSYFPGGQGPCHVNGNMAAPAGAVGWAHTHPFRKDEEMVICGPIKIQTMDGRWIDLMRSDGRPAYEVYRNQPSQLDRELMSNVNAIRRSQ
jgi:hypothetical protein